MAAVAAVAAAPAFAAAAANIAAVAAVVAAFQLAFFVDATISVCNSIFGSKNYMQMALNGLRHLRCLALNA